MNESPFIIEVTEANFEQVVVQGSADKLVLADFWADWCNPCKILIPILSKLAIEYDGSVILAKINSDQEKNLSANFSIRSLPTVKIFKQGKFVDEFHGALPESEIREYIEKHVFRESDGVIQQAEDAFAGGDTEKASELLESVLAQDPSNLKAVILSARISLRKNMPDVAENLIRHLPLNVVDNEDVHQINILISFSKDVNKTDDIISVESRISTDDSPELKYTLACLYALSNKYEEALKLLLALVEKDKNYKEGKAKKHMTEIFELLGGSGPIVNLYRVKLSRLLH